MRGWNPASDSDNFQHLDPDIVGIAETHLIGDAVLEVPGYRWIGQNRQLLHPRARCGSGGVGVLIREELCELFDVSVLDDQVEGILWLSFSSKSGGGVFKLCVCYLPPEYSSRQHNVQDFYDALLSQVYTYQQEGLFFLCGDFNGRIGERADSVEGADGVPERHVVDFKVNDYGECLLEFLLSSSCCVLNGRNHLSNDFTSTGQGSAVVDYCLVPHEYLAAMSDFQVLRAADLCQQSGCVGVVDVTRGVPDHSLLKWSTDVGVFLGGHRDKSSDPVVSSFVKHNLSSIPEGFLSGEECISAFDGMLQELEATEHVQVSLDSAYSTFCDVIEREMDNHLQPKNIVIREGLSNKRRKIKKQWWTDELSLLWNDFCVAEKKWSTTMGPEKAGLKAVMREKQRRLDTRVQRAKILFWKQQQDELLRMQSSNPKEFWKHVGRLGVAEERKRTIPMEVVIDNEGSISSDSGVVLERWRKDCQTMLNSDNLETTPGHGE